MASWTMMPVKAMCQMFQMSTLSTRVVRVSSMAMFTAMAMGIEMMPMVEAQAIGEVILVGAPNPLVGEVLTAVVSDGRDLPRLRSWARENLSGADRPRRWIHLSTFPLTASGKIDLKAIKMAVRKSHD